MPAAVYDPGIRGQGELREFREQYTDFPSLAPLPSACAPAFGAGADGRDGAPGAGRSAWRPGAAAAAVLALLDVFVRHAASQEAGPVGNASEQGRDPNEVVVATGQVGAGARPGPDPGLSDQAGADRVQLDIAGGRQRVGFVHG